MLLNRANVQTGEDVFIAAREFRRDLSDEVNAFRAQMRAFERRLIRLMFILWIGEIGVLLAFLPRGAGTAR
jgi:hypothetical protein